MKIEIIGGVKTTWHSDKDSTLQNMADLLLQLLFENEMEKRKEVGNNGGSHLLAK